MEQMQTLRRLLGKGELFPLRGGDGILRAEGCTREDARAAQAALLSGGGSVWDEWEENGSFFSTCLAGGRSWNIAWHARTGVLRIAEGGADNLAPRQAQDGSVRPQITQGRLLYYAADCGMLYVIRLADGRFAVIDGGMAEYEEPEHFLEILRAQNERGGAPCIAAWFITHAHDDHMNLFVRVCERLYDSLQIEAVCYNWAARERYARSSDLTGFERALALHPEIRQIKPRAGQRFFFPGARFDILYTHEGRAPEYLANFNDTSTVMRMESCGRRVMWTGDAMRETADLLCAQYAPETLKCDLMQVAHHGYSGGSDEFYRAVDPEALLWPCPDFWYYTQSALECNRYLSQSPNIRAMYMSGREETVLDLAALIVPSDPYARYKGLKPGDVLWDEDFSKPTIYELLKTAVTGGKTNYKSAALSLSENGLRMCADGEHYSVMELMQPGMMADAPGFTLRLSGRTEKAGVAALFWNYDAPWVYSEEQALDLRLEEGKEFSVELTADEKAGEAVYVNGGVVQRMQYTPAARRGLYLILKGAQIELTSARVVR
ncbi:MAG: hypothetical protein Q4A66_05185 [Eubacteriales bacterium]|nr:hypothetical protein [Eubacteriales bacterium]